MNYYKEYWSNWSNFSGRASRSEYWYALLFYLAVAIPLGFILPLFVIWALINVIPFLALTVRRLHDSGKSGAFIILLFIPVVGLINLIFMLLPSDPENQYGPPRN